MPNHVATCPIPNILHPIPTNAILASSALSSNLVLQYNVSLSVTAKLAHTTLYSFSILFQFVFCELINFLFVPVQLGVGDVRVEWLGIAHASLVVHKIGANYRPMCDRVL